jgi:radical SAM protein with 4Fe4S-binding SPASM domain
VSSVSRQSDQAQPPVSAAARLRALANAERIPLSLSIELTRACNLRCVHCYLGRDHGSDAPSPLPTARLVELLHEAATLGCMSVSLTGGEVALRPDWLVIAKAAKAQRMAVALTTNGTLFDEADIEAIAQLRPRRVAVSIYGGDASSHDAITGVSGSFERSLATLVRLRAAGVRCRVNHVLIRDNFEQYAHVVEIADSLGCSFLADPTVRPSLDGSAVVVQDHRASLDQLRRFFSDDRIAAGTQEGQRVRQSEPVLARGLRNCAAGFSTAWVLADGDIVPCMGFPSVGNVSLSSLAEVWRGEEADVFRAAMLRPLRACEACDVAGFCYLRCPRTASVEDGSISRPSAWACTVAGLLSQMRHERMIGTQPEASVPRG